MGIMDRLFGGSEPEKEEEPQTDIERILELVEVATVTSQVFESKTVKEKAALFNKLYENDDLTFQLVNLIASRIVSYFTFESEDEALVKKLQEWQIEIHLANKLFDIAVDAIIAGTAWVEPVANSETITRLVIINPETMDFIRDTKRYVVYDLEGKPVGYEQNFGAALRYWKKDEIVQGGQTIFKAKNGEDLRDRIRYFKLIGRGDSELGKSLIAPGYRSAIVRCNVTDMIGEASFRGGGIEAIYSGEMGANTKNKLKQDLKNITARNTMLHKDNITLKLLPMAETNQAADLVYQLADLQSAGMGVPVDLLLSGTRGYQKDLVSKIADMEIRIQALQSKLAEQINDKIIKPLLILWRKPGMATFKFISSSPGAQLNRARVIATLARRNLMTYDPELEIALRKELNLPVKLLNEVFVEWKKNGPPMTKPTIGEEQNVLDNKDEQDIEPASSDENEEEKNEEED